MFILKYNLKLIINIIINNNNFIYDNKKLKILYIN